MQVNGRAGCGPRPPCPGSRLQGDAIDVAARVIAVANRHDHLVNPIDYRQALSQSEARSTMWVKPIFYSSARRPERRPL